MKPHAKRGQVIRCGGAFCSVTKTKKNEANWSTCDHCVLEVCDNLSCCECMDAHILVCTKA